jgi:hypothetical protein
MPLAAPPTGVQRLQPYLRLAFHLDFSLGFDFKLSLDLRLQFEDCRAQWVVDADLLADDLERDRQRVACAVVSGSLLQP